jgi:hypothetical protein
VNAAGRLGAFGVVLACALGGGAALGAVAGPEPSKAPSTDAHGATHDAGASHDLAASLPGLAVSEQGYTLVPDSTVLASADDRFTFRIVGPDGQVVQRFETRHDKELHLIVVSRDLTRYQHVHPARDSEGRWSIDLHGLEPGPVRVLADFQPAGGPVLTLGVDASVPGDFRVAPRPDATRHADVDGFSVELEGDVVGGEDAALVVKASRAGAPAALEPYLGAGGHLVALREGDLAYLHVHPEESAGVPGEVRFRLEVPSAGRYRLFFDFQVGGVVRTADFTVDVPARNDPAVMVSGDGHDDAN